MTEEEWLTCSDPALMFPAAGEFCRPSERKHRLFALTCCNSMQDLIANESLKAAVDILARYTEDNASISDLLAAHRTAVALCKSLEGGDIKQWAAAQTVVCATHEPHDRTWPDMDSDYDPYESIGLGAADNTRSALARSSWNRITAAVRDIFGPFPFRHVTLDPAWITPTVTRLAAGIYDEKAFDRLPVLADALEESGCTNADVLQHCRGPGPHLHGCWVVDLVLGKQ
jgi:hypothetical protein